MKKQTKNKFFILLICLLIQACSASNEQKGVVSSEDLTIQTTITVYGNETGGSQTIPVTVTYVR